MAWCLCAAMVSGHLSVWGTAQCQRWCKESCRAGKCCKSLRGTSHYVRGWRWFGVCSRHTLCITADGSAFAWGANSRGQLGVGDGENRRLPALVTGLQGKQVVNAAAGCHHTICTTADGSVSTWGNGGHGKLGLGDGSRKLVPTQLTGELKNEAVMQVAIVAGAEHSACVTRDGCLYAWGSNGHSQLGAAGVNDADLPGLVRASNSMQLCRSTCRLLKSDISHYRLRHPQIKKSTF